ncbi:CDP-diacylglycerol--inositol 3-phosphatidyltransferase isoform X1 [Chiloscyllium punctatum]|uniref:CDP-diacylglycerol--inositol 3-phosphatidyltransferase isoform X1 n=1 Tax=Chiloscyllium punctatum TaxID=137246 RepID=UPI003B634A11
MVSVFLFVPNLIGYSRIILALIAFYFMPSDPALATCLYLLSSFLDSLDGHAARLLNQCSKFGMMLDMLTDRCATMCLLVNLSLLYPRYVFLFQLSMILDISSHWLHLHSTMMKGSNSHKKIDLSENPILYVYYTNTKVLFVMCAGNELFYAMLYLLTFMEGPVVPLLNTGLFQLLLYSSFPICAIKTVINIIHLITASRNMAAMDQAEGERGLNACKMD